MSVVAVLGGSNFAEGSLEYDSAVYVGKMLAEAGHDLLTGGYDGIMEAALKGAADFPVKKIGVVTDFNPQRPINSYVTEVIKTDSYLDRVRAMIDMSDAFVVLPGDIGTLLQLAAVWALKERNMIDPKPLICVGDQWFEVIQTMSFYSEEVLDSNSNIYHCEVAEDVADYLNEALNNK